MINQSKIHVVHIIAEYSSSPYLNWMAERFHNYPDVKFTIVSLYPEKPLMIEDMRIRGCDCYWIKYDNRFRKRWVIYAFLKLYFLLKKLKPDVVNTHLLDDSLLGLFAARIIGIKKRIILKHATALNWYYSRFWVLGDRLNNINATDIIAISEESKEFLLEKEKAPPEKIHLIHNGIPIAQYTMQTDEEKLGFINKYKLKDKIVIGTVARYVEWKGYRYIIEAAKILVNKHPNLKFIFAGQGSQQEEIETLVKQYALEEYISITGFIDPKHMPSLYGIMDIYLHAAFMEPFGLVFIEAMANGVPIVTSKTGIAAEILEHKSTCYFTNYKDPEGIVNGIEWMLKNPEAREAMKEKIKRIASEKFNMEQTMDKYIRLYKGLL